MGIPAYFSFIVKNHPSIIRKFCSSLAINNLYLDANSIIYDSIRNIDFATLEKGHIPAIVEAVIHKICSYVENIKPSDSLLIAFDGVAPVAKLEQQRQRRFKSQYQLQISRTVYKNPKLDPFNTTAITPGTIFMKELNAGIRSYFCNPSQLNLKTIILSLSDIAGEGEHKIFEYIRNNAEAHKFSNTVIYGLDADLIMLSLNHLHLSEQIYLFRETPEFIKSISAELEPNELYYLDIKSLAVAISQQMTDSEVDIVNTRKIFDYLLICFFLGNDFMPHFPALNIRTGGVDKVIMAYKETIKEKESLVLSDFNIDWAQLRKFVHFLALQEEKYFLEETTMREKFAKRYYPATTPEEAMKKFEALPLIQRGLENKIKPSVHGWQDRYYLNLFHLADIPAVCTNYLQMLEWNIKYYSQGCVDWRFKYHFHYPPLLQDLIHHIPVRQAPLLRTAERNPVSELTQLCYVLPRNCLYLLPKKIEQTLMEQRERWYVNRCDFIWAYCRYFWECHADLPEINICDLEDIIK